MSIFPDLEANIPEASPASKLRLARECPAEVETRCAGCRESALYEKRPDRAQITLLPYAVIRREPAVDLRCVRLQRTDVKRQHKFLKLATLWGSEKCPYRAWINSASEKKKRASRSAFSSESDAWIAFLSFDSA